MKYEIPISMDMGARYGLSAGDGDDSSKMDMDIIFDIKNIETDTGKSIEFPDFKDFKESTQTTNPLI